MADMNLAPVKAAAERESLDPERERPLDTPRATGAPSRVIIAPVLIGIFDMTRDFTDPSLLDDLDAIASQAGERNHAGAHAQAPRCAPRPMQARSPRPTRRRRRSFSTGLRECLPGIAVVSEEAASTGSLPRIAGHLHPGRSARRHPRIHRRPRRVHRQYRDRARRTAGHRHCRRAGARCDLARRDRRRRRTAAAAACGAHPKDADRTRRLANRRRITAAPGARWSAARMLDPDDRAMAHAVRLRSTAWIAARR